MPLTSVLNATFEADTDTSPNGQCLNYRIHRPANLEPMGKLPLILFFHGAGERGNDNESQLRHGVRDILAYSQSSSTPAIIIAPQCPTDCKWVATPWDALSHTMPATPSVPMRLVLERLDQTIATLPVDTSRIYVTGISMGGFATWDIIQRYPQRFAAALPICGGGDTAMAPQLKHLPIWAFHGGKDTVVQTSRSRDMIAAIRKAGGTPHYTEYPELAHDSWSRTYADQKVLHWLFSQSLSEKGLGI